MRAIVLPLLLLLLIPSLVDSTPRAVVTFLSKELNNASGVPENVTVVKQYGRRLVLHLGREVSEEDTEWLKWYMGGNGTVQTVEPDEIVG